MTMRPMFQERWSDPIPWQNWRSSPTGPGLYVIGRALNEYLPIGASPDNDGKLGGFPVNFVQLYIGHSLSSGRGVRARLSAHAQGRGNRSVNEALGNGLPLWFVYLSGRGMAEYETLYLDLPNGMRFPFNARPETTRALRRMFLAMEAQGLIGAQLELGLSHHALTGHRYDFSAVSSASRREVP